MNMDNQMYVTENENYYEVEIDNFINSPYVTYNEKRQPYATSLVVEVPKSTQEKIQLDHVTWEGPVAGGDLAYEKVQKDFVDFSVYDEDSTTPEPIIVEPGDEIIAVRPTTDDYKIVNYHLPKTSTKSAAVKFAENCRYAVLKATQTAAQVSSFLMKCVNTYNKVAMIVPRFLIPLATVADYEANGSVNINGEEIYIQAIDNDNAVELPVDTYVIEF